MGVISFILKACGTNQDRASGRAIKEGSIHGSGQRATGKGKLKTISNLLDYHVKSN